MQNKFFKESLAAALATATDVTGRCTYEQPYLSAPALQSEPSADDGATIALPSSTNTSEVIERIVPQVTNTSISVTAPEELLDLDDVEITADDLEEVEKITHLKMTSLIHENYFESGPTISTCIAEDYDYEFILHR